MDIEPTENMRFLESAMGLIAMNRSICKVLEEGASISVPAGSDAHKALENLTSFLAVERDSLASLIECEQLLRDRLELKNETINYLRSQLATQNRIIERLQARRG